VSELESESRNDSGGSEEEGGRVGLLLSSKAVVQLLANPVVGALVARIGGRIPLVAGTANLLLAALRM